MSQVKILEKTAKQLQVPLPTLAKDSVRAYLERQLWQERSLLHEMRAKYGLRSAAQLQQQYEQGKLAEDGSWEDYFRFNHAESRVKKLEKMLSEV